MPLFAFYRPIGPVLAGILLAVAVGGYAPIAAQPATKPALDHDAYDIWNQIDEERLSPDGRWLLYTVGPMDFDKALRVVALQTDSVYEVPRGAGARFGPGSGYVAFLIKPPRDSVRQAKLDERKPEAMPKDSLGLMDLQTGAVVRMPRIKSFAWPEEAGARLAYLLEAPETDEDDAGDDEESEEAQGAEPGAEPEPEPEPGEPGVEPGPEPGVEPGAEPGAEPAEDEAEPETHKAAKPGTPLILRHAASGQEFRFEHATAYAFSKDGTRLFYTASSEDGTADGVYAVDVATGTAAPLLTGEGDYVQLAVSEAGDQVAFLTNRDDLTSDPPAFTLYHWRTGADSAAARVAAGAAGLPGGWWVSEHGALAFSESGRRLTFGTAPRPAPEPEEEKVPEDEQVKLDVWHWQDPYLQPMQLVQADEEKKRTYAASLDLESGAVVQLATEAMPEVRFADAGEPGVSLGVSNVPYRHLISWDYPGRSDYYAVDAETGAAQPLLEEQNGPVSFSPDGGYLAWWDRDERAWFARSVEGGDPVNLTAAIPHSVHDLKHDWPYEPDPEGSAGWTTGDDGFLLYDAYDVWWTDPSGRRPPRNLTGGVGRAEGLRFRYVRLDPEEDAIDLAAPVLLSAFDTETKAGGFYRLRGTQPPEALVHSDHAYARPVKADDADVLLFRRESFTEFPDLWVSGLDMSDARRVSDVNPQQADYRWGSVELVHWTSVDGAPLDGLLYKPEGFDPAQQYPMMVYFYEKYSDNLHSHYAPEPYRSYINFSFYASRGYLVFVPDIPYKIGYPGESALEAVMSGVTALMDAGFVDRDRIGVQGHSWGGYQIAYMVTRTNLFAAAEAGAPVANMVSAYGGIRWGTGMSRMFQYERTQSRIGGSLWEYPLRYIENSPIFMADRIETPLLIMHNDEDTAVPWYQGIELFVALRRLGKPVWMINYNGEPHWPTTYANKRDWTIRMQQYFDHYLKDAPVPVWLESGIPAVDKGKTLGLEPAESIAAPAAATEAATTESGSQEEERRP